MQSHLLVPITKVMQAHQFGTTDEEAEAIRRAASALTTTTATLAQVALEWNHAGFLTSRGNPWRFLQVKRALRKPIARQVLGEFHHDALLARLGREALRPPLPGSDRTRIGTCGTCGSAMHRYIRADGAMRLVCTARMEGRTRGDGLTHPQIVLAYVETRVRDAVSELIAGRSAPVLDYLPRDLSTIATLCGDLEARQRRLHRLVDDADAPVTAADVARDLRAIDADLALLEAERADYLLAAALERLGTGTEAELNARWDLLPAADRTTIATRLVAVTIDTGRGPGRVRIESLLS
ncbi:hypothetical protein CLV52_2665 [Amnibacterium kyonggiense]|uniref:Recombinase-like zinc beta ribbon protein n=2 Tax=Amnibacterium kyonggiense TaxID=595671 RepID=A0A4V6Q0Z7_9MICO|nr:hypothetical protein CLV52_2665 [Amnibacterium kyonggiense]